MGYERYPINDPQRDDDYGRDQGSGRDDSFSSARDYQAAGAYGRDQRPRDDRYRYGPREQMRRGYASQDRGDQYRGDQRQQGGHQGSYASDGHRFTQTGRQDDGRQQRNRFGGDGNGDYGGQPQGYDYQERGFFDRAGDEVRSWFGDDDANRRRDLDARYDERGDNGRGRSAHDDNYHSWRQTQIDALDRDYHEYRQENRSKFDTEFGSWRAQRQTQRSSLGKVEEHMEVVGSDGGHVGTVDKVRGDRILLTKNDQDAGGRHHSIPSRWIDSVDGKVTISKSADEAKSHWRDEERNQAMFGDKEDTSDDGQGRILGRSFSGT